MTHNSERLEDIRLRVNKTPGGQWHWDRFSSDEVNFLLTLIDGEATSYFSDESGVVEAPRIRLVKSPIYDIEDSNESAIDDIDDESLWPK